MLPAGSVLWEGERDRGVGHLQEHALSGSEPVRPDRRVVEDVAKRIARFTDDPGVSLVKCEPQVGRGLGVADDMAVSQVQTEEVRVGGCLWRAPRFVAHEPPLVPAAVRPAPPPNGLVGYPRHPLDRAVGQRLGPQGHDLEVFLARTHDGSSFHAPSDGRTCSRRYDPPSQGHWPNWIKAPVSKTGDSRFESWVPRLIAKRICLLG